jgi:drug/metabolite transporter (DMT)-like permease
MIGEKISNQKIIGILMGSAGATILILYHGDLSFSANTFTGNLMALLNTLAYAFYMVLIKPVMVKYHPITVMKWVFLFGFITALPFTLGSLSTFSAGNLGAGQWLALAFVIIATTFMAYLLTIFALKYLEAGVVSFYIYFQPIIATAIAFWLGKHDFTPSKVIAIMTIFAGVYLVSKKQNGRTEPIN